MKIINKKISLSIIILLFSFGINYNIDAAENNFENISIASPYPFIRLFQQDIELVAPGLLAEGKPFEVELINLHHNTYAVQTNFAPWDESFYFIVAIKDGSWQQVSNKYSGKQFKNKCLWIIEKNNRDEIK